MPRADRTFRTGEAARLTGVSARTLDFWDRSKFISPSAGAAAGTGTERAYSFEDLVRLKIAGNLRRAGVTSSTIRKLLPGACFCESGSASPFVQYVDGVVSIGVDIEVVSRELRAAIPKRVKA